MGHICAACQRPRSSSYHERHPLVPGKIPRPGVCSRCVKEYFLQEPIQSSPTVTSEVHHHHYHVHHYYFCQHDEVESIATPDEPPSPRAELPSETFHRHSPTWMEDQSPPPVYQWTKPVLPQGF
ncbi:hypothetical protein B0J14DRAFT_598011 [Halenospora varia]|nr:hypothetical protein B0J14DRAFT_598011 [Halenospora varia]